MASDVDWVGIIALEDIPARGARRIASPRGDIAVFRAADDSVFALFDRCPHKGGPLSQGIVHGKSVTCPLHNWVIGLESGEAQGADKGCAHTVPAKIENGTVFLAASAFAKSAA